jgi:hypothetical protein
LLAKGSPRDDPLGDQAVDGSLNANGSNPSDGPSPIGHEDGDPLFHTIEVAAEIVLEIPHTYFHFHGWPPSGYFVVLIVATLP